MKDAGNLDRLVQIRKPVTQQTASGQVRHILVAHRTCYAHRLASQNKTGGERYEADQLVEVRDVQWIVRATDVPIDATMVLTYGDTSYWITKVEEFQLKNRPSRNAFLLINTELRDNE
jgi:head-tail adaptor